MKKLLLLLSLLTPITGLGASGGGKIDASYIESVRQSSAPSSPASGKVRWYTLDSDGKLYVKNSGGTAKACTYSGDIVNADLSGSAGITNANMASMNQSTFKCRTTASTGVPEDCTAAQSQAIIGTVPQVLTHQTTPSIPPAGSVKLYVKSDNKTYLLNSSGTETEVGSGATQPTILVDGSGGNSTTTSGDYKIHTFTSSGKLDITTASLGGKIEILAVGGGGGGGSAAASYGGGGGGGGGQVTEQIIDVNLPVSFTVTVGGGGGAQTNGTDSTVAPVGGGALVVGKGGGAGGAGAADCGSGSSGGSGGGGGADGGGGGPTCAAGAANGVGTFAGGLGCQGCPQLPGGGGGGASEAGAAAISSGTAGDGGDGKQATTICGGALSGTYYGGGGGGGVRAGIAVHGLGGLGGGGRGGCNGSTSCSPVATNPANPEAGTANTGGGGGGGNYNGNSGAAGGSGIVIVCYRYQ